MDAQVVYETQEDMHMTSGPFGYEKVGVRLEDRVIWLSTLVWPSMEDCDERQARHEHWKSVAEKIVTALKE